MILSNYGKLFVTGKRDISMCAQPDAGSQRKSLKFFKNQVVLELYFKEANVLLKNLQNLVLGQNVEEPPKKSWKFYFNSHNSARS